MIKKNTVSVMKNSLDEINSKSETAEEKVSKTESIQSATQRKKTG